MQPSPSKCHQVNLVGFVFISFSIGCANVVNDISVVCADRRGGDCVGEAVVAVVAIDIGVNRDGSGAVGCAVIVNISVVVGRRQRRRQSRRCRRPWGNQCRRKRCCHHRLRRLRCRRRRRLRRRRRRHLHLLFQSVRSRRRRWRYYHRRDRLSSISWHQCR